MQRQKSILSFFQKPSSESQRAGDWRFPQFPATQQSQKVAGFGQPTAADSALEITGTDTPPEKVPRQVLPESYVGDEIESGSSLFSSIVRKFAKPDDREKASEMDTPPEKVPRQILPASCVGNESKSGSTLLSSIMHKFAKPDDGEKASERNIAFEKSNEPRQLCKPEASSQHSRENDSAELKGKIGQSCVIHIGSDDDILGPETPGAQRLVPRLKRIQEDAPNSEDKYGRSLLGSSKKLKLLEETTPFKNNHGQVSDTASKFEWLDPSRIRDANGRKPDDPLFNNTTLYIPPDALKKMSASQKQYWNVKCQYMDVVLFFKVGKFYELYELDAEIGHKELDWKITLSGVGKCRQVGVSESGIDDAIQKLVARGHKVGRIEQLETSSESKARGANSVISRKLVQVLSPSTATDANIGPDAVHLLALKEGMELDNGTNVYGFAFVDCAALKFWVGSIKDDASLAGLGALLMQVSPKEVLYEGGGLSKDVQKALKKYSLAGSSAIQLTPMQPITDFADASEVRNLIELKKYFKGASSLWTDVLDNEMHHDVTLSALGGLITHLSRLMLDDVLRNGDVLQYQVYSGCLRMDGQTLVNLEIFSNNADGGPSGTLYKYLDNCVTSSGKRFLRRWICHPLKDAEEINNRLNVVEELLAHPEIMLLVAQYLRKVPDLERSLGRIRASVQSSAILSLPVFGKKVLKQRVRLLYLWKDSFTRDNETKETLRACGLCMQEKGKREVKAFGTLVKGLRVGFELLQLLEKEKRTFALLLKLFKLPVLGGSNGLVQFLSQFEAAIDSDFPNYQNHDVAEPDVEILSILIELFIEKVTEWSQVINAINCLDVLRSFAVAASSSCGAMSRPVIVPRKKNLTSGQETRGPVLKIKGLWHPFAFGDNGRVPVPNDVDLGEDTEDYHPHTMLLTGPNMGGKSTLLRSTCLAVILAQLGCYVPCEMCVFSLVDIIFTRLGATDRIMAGESTFFVECTETASVLHNATRDSLVILDELGRGTSTFDGYAIAYAVLRHLIEKVNCRLLFATHYHPLTKEFASHPHVTLQHMACSFKPKSECFSKNEELVFLYRLSSGACPESYGLQVATMAGIPEQVVKAASKASQRMKRSIGDSFRASEGRSEFSSLHEEWLKSLIAVSRIGDHSGDEDDVFDSLFCLWYELKSSYRSGN